MPDSKFKIQDQESAAPQGRNTTFQIQDSRARKYSAAEPQR
jgi:hypothetical protein